MGVLYLDNYYDESTVEILQKAEKPDSNLNPAMFPPGFNDEAQVLFAMRVDEAYGEFEDMKEEDCPEEVFNLAGILCPPELDEEDQCNYQIYGAVQNDIFDQMDTEVTETLMYKGH